MRVVCRRTGKRPKSKDTRREKKVKKIGYLIIAITLVMSICNYWNFVKYTNEWTNKTVNMTDRVVVEWVEDLAEENGEIVQTFFTEKNFNEISIGCNVIKENKDSVCQYKIQLLEEETVLEEFLVGVDDVNNSSIELRFHTISPSQKQEYKIRIVPETLDATDSIKWCSRFSKVTDQYEGEYLIDGEKQTTDLFIKVYRIKEASYMNAFFYYLIVVGALMWEIGLLYLICQKDYRLTEKNEL